MSSVLQGTTPSLTIQINETDFTVTDVIWLELTFQNSKTTWVKNLTDVVVNSEGNSFTYTFTETETLALSPVYMLFYQLRFGFDDGTIVGTKKASFKVEDLISEAVMSE